MDFDANDPLGDLLSDDSNDSFFNDDIKDSTKAKDQKVSSSKKSDLFGLEQKQIKPNAEETKPNKPKDDWLGLSDSKSPAEKKNVEIKSVISNIQKPSNEIVNQQKTPKQNMFKDDLDFLDDIGLSDDKLSLKSDKNAKSSLNLDDLLGKSQNIKANVSGYAPTVVKNVQQKKEGVADVVLLPTESKVKVIGRTPATNQPPVKKEIPKRQRKNQDWLGLFSDDILGEGEEKGETLTDILSKNEKKVEVPKEKSKEEPQTESAEKLQESKKEEIAPLPKIDEKPFSVLPDLMNSSILGLSGNVDIEQQSAAICLQQQESHLMVALQMKAQEERLAAMQERQEESRRIQRQVVSAHREQLDNILKGQNEHRTQLKNIITEHQQRINKHIEVLLKPPSIESNHKVANEEKDDDKNITEVIPSKKQHLEEVIHIIKENYNKEIELMETSYRRQILHVNESMQSLEDMYKKENAKLSQYYVDRIELLEQDKDKIIGYFEDRIKFLLEKQNDESDRTEKKHLDDIEVLQKQHNVVVRNIADTIKFEKETIKSATDYSQKLELLADDIQNNSKLCQDIMKKVEEMTRKEFKEKEEALKLKEDHLNRMLEVIEKQSKSYEIEVSETKATLQLFERRLIQQNQTIEEERQSLRQKELTLNREKDEMKHSHEQLKQKHEYEKELFKKTVAEFEKSNFDAKMNFEERLKQLESESNALKSEKKALQEMKTELQMLKMRIDEETNELNEERNKIRLEKEKLYQKEQEIYEKSKDLDVLTRNALVKQKNSEAKLAEAAFAQHRFEEKLMKLQEQSLSLNSREQQLIKEKVHLSRERLNLHNQHIESQHAICNICKTASNPQKLTNTKYEDGLRMNNAVYSSDDIVTRYSWLDNVDFKDNNSEQKNSLAEHELNNTVLNNDSGIKDHVQIKFQDIVDPQLMAMKFDIFKTKNFL